MTCFVVGDIHGCFDQLVSLLESSSLIDKHRNWTGGANQLWCLGDLMDRGPQGVDCIALLMELGKQAAETGGEVNSLLGNHEIMFLASLKFAGIEKHAETFRQHWMNWGGQKQDRDQIEPAHVEWLSNRPAIAVIKNRLFMHSDTTSYVNFGVSVQGVNDYFTRLMSSQDATQWYETLAAMCQRGDFDLELGGVQRASQMLRMFGGESIVHGHSPSTQTRTPLVYANGLCCNVDAGLYLGNDGYLLTLN